MNWAIGRETGGRLFNLIGESGVLVGLCRG